MKPIITPEYVKYKGVPTQPGEIKVLVDQFNGAVDVIATFEKSFSSIKKVLIDEGYDLKDDVVGAVKDMADARNVDYELIGALNRILTDIELCILCLDKHGAFEKVACKGCKAGDMEPLIDHIKKFDKMVGGQLGSIAVDKSPDARSNRIKLLNAIRDTPGALTFHPSELKAKPSEYAPGDEVVVLETITGLKENIGKKAVFLRCNDGGTFEVFLEGRNSTVSKIKKASD